MIIALDTPTDELRIEVNIHRCGTAGRAAMIEGRGYRDGTERMFQDVFHLDSSRLLTHLYSLVLQDRQSRMLVPEQYLAHRIQEYGRR